MVRKGRQHRRGDRAGGSKRPEPSDKPIMALQAGAAPEAANRATSAPEPGVRTFRKDVVLFVVIILCAFSLRLIYVLQLRDSPLFDSPTMDARYHDEWAQAIASGEIFIEGPYFRAPLYPALLATVYKVFGYSYVAPRVIQAILGALSCGLLFLIGLRVFGRVVGAVAGFVAAGYWMLIYFDGELLIPSLIIFLDLMLIYTLLLASKAPGRLVYGLAGVVLGLTAIARPNVLLFGPAVVAWLIVLYRREFGRAVTYALCVTAGCLLVIAPITIRNYLVGKDAVLIASQGGVNFYIGNSSEADGITAIVPGTSGGWWGGYYGAIERAEQARGRKLKPSEVSRYYYGEAWKFIREQPGAYLRLLGWKLGLFWTRWEISNNKGIYFWTEQFTPVVRWLPLGFGVIGPLGIVGLVLCWRRRAALFPLWGFVLVYMAGVVLFFCTARYRMPVVPVLILLAAYAVSQGLRTVRQSAWGHLLAELGLLAVAAGFVNLTHVDQWFRNDTTSWVMLGRAYERQHRSDLAADSYRQAIALAPTCLTAHLNLGKLLRSANRLPEAIEEFRLAATCRPVLQAGETSDDLASAHFHLAGLLKKNGNHAEAIHHYQTCMDLDSSGRGGRAPFNLAMLLNRLGRTDEAMDYFARAVDPLRDTLRGEPDDVVLLHALGRSLYRLGRYGEALEPLRRCVKIQPTNRWARDILTDALMRTGHREEADRIRQGQTP